MNLPLSSDARQSVAYVSALSGIEPYRNARRILGWGSDRVPTHPLYPEIEGAGEMVYGNIEKIYVRSGDRRIALLLLTE